MTTARRLYLLSLIEELPAVKRNAVLALLEEAEALEQEDEESGEEEFNLPPATVGSCTSTNLNLCPLCSRRFNTILASYGVEPRYLVDSWSARTIRARLHALCIWHQDRVQERKA